MKRLAIAFALGGLLTVGLVASCRQGEGERCQINDDCDDPLICVEATHTCASSNTSMGIDALAPTDAPDAAVDAAVDARDAM